MGKGVSRTEMSPMTYIYRFMALSGRERRLFVEAVLWLGFCQLALLLPFRWLAPHLGARMKHAISRAAHHVPWNAKCLVQAMAGKFMLRCRKVESTLYLGVAKENENQLKAHAWLRCGRQVVCGGRGMMCYTVISRFGG